MTMAQQRPDRTLGPDHDTFWQHCAAGELRLPHCTACGELAWPVVQACEFCGKTDFTWQAMSGRGTIVSWCSFERDYYAGMLPMPWDTILVELEGGPLFMSNPDGFGWRDITPGMPVRVAFIDCEDSAGPFRLPVFTKD
jgi:uncharacterized OB-fold protein